MLRIGLTGNIAVGKSCVSARFAALGAAVIDADHISRELMEQGAPVYSRVVKEFGTKILRHDGTIDRRRLGNIVFASEDKRRLLESITHPAIHAAIDRKIAELEKASKIIIVEAALMIETGGYREYDRLIVVSCSPAMQLSRLMTRDLLTESGAKTRIAAQMPTDEKVCFADYVIDASGSIESTMDQVNIIYKNLLLMFHDINIKYSHDNKR
jgi:dephospho-CoA kinase